jgi:hypothetical protein
MVSRFVVFAFLTLFIHNDVLTQTPDGSKHRHQGRKRELKQFMHVDLGICFEYDIDSFDNNPDGLPSSNEWQLYKNPALGIQFRLPPGYSVRIDAPIESHTWATPPCDHCSIQDSCLAIFFKDRENNLINAVDIYFTSADFRHIAWDESFLPELTDRDIYVDIKEEDTTLIQSALAENKWESMGRQGMKSSASYLDGIVWKGLRGSNFSGVYNDQGYAGLDWMHLAFLMRRITDRCSIVFSYNNVPSNRPPLKEYRFYDIVASVQVLK